MEKTEVVKTIKLINAVYPKSNIQFDKDTTDVWYELLSSYDFELVKSSILDISKRMKFVPSISEIIENLPSYNISASKKAGGMIVIVESPIEKLPFRFTDQLDYNKFKTFISQHPTFEEIKQEYYSKLKSSSNYVQSWGEVMNSKYEEKKKKKWSSRY